MNSNDSKFDLLAAQAVLSGQYENLLLALDGGADPNSIAGNIDLLTHALVRKYTKMAGLLIDKGATPNHHLSKAWHFLSFRMELSNLKFLFKKFDFIETKDSKGRTPLSFLMERNRLDKFKQEKIWKIIEILVEKGSNPNQALNNGKSAIEFICENCYLNKSQKIDKWISLFLKKGLNPNLPSTQSGFLIHAPFLFKSVESISLLLDSGADPSLSSLTQKPVEFTLIEANRIDISKKVWKLGEGLNRVWGNNIIMDFVFKLPIEKQQPWLENWALYQKEQLDKKVNQNARDLKKISRI